MSTLPFTPNLGLAAAAVGLGAALGAIARWQLSAWLNPLHEEVPLGTLACNLIGGYLVGIAVVWLAQNPELSPAWRLFIVTGFLGGLTTFSTFSAEVVGLLQQERLGMAAMVVGLHLGGSLAGTLAGLATISALKA